ncbi:MAG: zinc-binding dehydrogenase [Gammaproteobacteria bacterium]
MVAVRQSTVLQAPIATVWRILRDFNSHRLWHPAIAASEIEDGAAADAVGAVRCFRLQDGGLLREQLLSLSDSTYTLTYCLLEAPVPLLDYVATIRLRPVTDTDATFWEWHSTFAPPAQRREEMIRLVTEQIYQAGFAALRQYLAAPISPPTPAPAPTPVSDPTPQPAPVVSPAASVNQNRTAVLTPAIVVSAYGGPEVMQLQQIKVPAPGPGQVQIRQSFIGVNFIDVYCRNGHFNLLNPPGIPGMEAAGTITALGPGVSGLSVGERVAYACAPVGAYTGLRNMSPDLLVKLPPDISEETAAAVLLKGVTASFLLHEVHTVRQGDTVLLYAAAGGVGQLLLQWLVQLEAQVIAVVSTPEKADIARRLGAAAVILHTREAVADRVMELTGGQGVTVAYDAVGASTFADSLEALAPRGHLVSYGEASGPIGPQDISRFSARSITLSRPNYSHYTDTPAQLATQTNRLFAMLRNGAIRLAPPRHYALSEAAQAHADLEGRRTTGSVLLLP